MDREGLQLGELVFFSVNGVSDAGMIGASGQGRATNIINTLAKGDPSGLKVLNALDHAGFDIKTADSVRIFEQGSRAGDTVDFFASSDGLLVLAAPGGAMLPESQNSSTELIVYIRRATPEAPKGGLLPPDPLADPLIDLNIQPGNAKTFSVKAEMVMDYLTKKTDQVNVLILDACRNNPLKNSRSVGR